MAQRESVALPGQLSEAYTVEDVELELVDRPADQIRFDLDPEPLEELARSIAREGLINAPTLRAVGDRYQVVAGDRRIAAMRLLGWRRAPARVLRRVEGSLLALAAHENLFRLDLSPVEEAGAVKAMLDEGGGDVDACARRINRTRSWVDSRLRILGWPADVQRAVHVGELSAAAGAELAGVTDDGHRAFLLEHAVKGGATARTCQAWRIAWEQTGVATGATVQQIAPGRTAPAPVEAELPCYFHGNRERYGRLVHIWLCPDAVELFNAFREAYLGGSEGGGPAVVLVPGESR
jgi:ParB/RepB/Spo0J family partition protein